MAHIIVNVEDIWKARGQTALVAEISSYIEAAKAAAGEGNDVTLTGGGPVWLYLCIAHALHGKARKLSYAAPALEKPVVIFDHTS